MKKIRGRSIFSENDKGQRLLTKKGGRRLFIRQTFPKFRSRYLVNFYRSLIFLGKDDLSCNYNTVQSNSHLFTECNHKQIRFRVVSIKMQGVSWRCSWCVCLGGNEVYKGPEGDLYMEIFVYISYIMVDLQSCDG